MRVRFLLWLIVAFGLTSRTCLAEGSSAPPDLTRASIVIVSAHLAEHHDTIGAGVVVAFTPYGLRALTARHVVASGDVRLWIDHRPYPAEVVRTFAHRDLALLEAVVPAAVRVLARIAQIASPQTPDDALLVWGEDDAGPRMERASLISPAYRSLDDGEAPPLVAIACARCDRGDSGGGIFSADGTLLAILTANYITRTGRVIATVGERVSLSLFGPLGSVATSAAGGRRAPSAAAQP